MADQHIDSFELHAGALRLALRPDLGGCIAGFWHRDMPILLSAEPGSLSASRPSGGFPLVPYSNRLGYRRFRWKGHDHTTRANFGDHPHSIHGVGWQRPWEIVSSSVLEVVRHAGFDRQLGAERMFFNARAAIAHHQGQASVGHPSDSD